MSTKDNFVLTDGSKFYLETKEMGDLGQGLKVYKTRNGAISYPPLASVLILMPTMCAVCWTNTMRLRKTLLFLRTNWP
jgi:hypothetical protein